MTSSSHRVLGHALLQVVRDDYRHAAAVERERVHVGLDPGFLLHVVESLGVELARVGQAGREHVHLQQLARVQVQDAHGVPDVIDLHLLCRLALDMHGDLVRHSPFPVPLAERRVHVGLLARRQSGVAVLRPQHHERNARAPHLPVDPLVVDLGLRCVGLGLPRVDDRAYRRVVHLLRQRPLQPARLRPVGDGDDRRRGTPARERDVPDAYPHGPLPEDLPVLDHFLLLFSRWPRAPFAPIDILLEKEAPLAGRVSILLVGVYQPTVEHCSSDVWNGVAKAVK